MVQLRGNRTPRRKTQGSSYPDLEKCVKKYFSAYCGNRPAVEYKDVAAIMEKTDAFLHHLVAKSGEIEPWLYFRVSADIGNENVPLFTEIAPKLQELTNQHPQLRWWWLCKRDVLGAAVRLRILAPAEESSEVEQTMIDHFKRYGREVRILQYEPELRLFGGSHGMEAAHDLFCEDSKFLAAWARSENRLQRPVIPEGLSVSFLFHLLSAAGLDLFERWDVFERVSDKRKLDRANDEKYLRFQMLVKRALTAGSDRVFRLYDGEKARLILGYKNSLEALGSKLSRLYFDGALGCGLREFLVPIILFHWNRVGLTAFRQSSISRALAQECERMVHGGATEIRYVGL